VGGVSEPEPFCRTGGVFEDAYPEGMPTIPIRRQLYTGRRIVPTYYYYQHEPVQLPGWHPLYNEDVTLSEVLSEAGYATALIADLPHLQRPGRNFHRGYRYFDWVRGQEIDYLRPGAAPTAGLSGLISG
jgi:arylsulfatase A-like enzyme